MGAFKEAHGGELKDLYLAANAAMDAKRHSRELRSWDLSERQLCDLELLLNGAFSPLDGFMGRADYERVRDEMRLGSGVLWPMPITLDVSREFAKSIEPGHQIVLRDREGVALAVMSVADAWEPDKRLEAVQVFGADDQAHPAVRYLLHEAG